MKLFTTLRPPVIDKSSMYYMDNSPSQQVVRSRGQFSIPSMDDDEEDTLLDDCGPFKVKEEVIDDEEEDGDDHMFHGKTLTNELPILPAAHSTTAKLLRHPLEYSQDYYTTKAYPPSIQPFNGPVRAVSAASTSGLHSNDHSNSSFPDLSFLTPMKTDLLNSENSLTTVSPSMTPSQNNKRSYYHVPGGPPNQSYSPLCTPLKPLLTEAGVGDSGVFSPSNFQFCTPIKDIGELLQITTSHDTDLYNQFESVPCPCHKSLLCAGLHGPTHQF